MKKLFFLLLVNCTFASTLDEIRDRGVLRVATFDDNLPFSTVDEKEKGVDIEIAKALAKAVFDDEDKIEFIIVDNGDRVPALMGDTADIVVANFSATQWRAKAVDFSSPYVKSNLALVFKKSKPVNGLADLSTMKIGAIKNALGAEFIKKRYPNLAVVEFSNQEELSKALESNDIDVFVRDSLLALRIVHENQNLSKFTFGDYIYSAPAVKKGNKELLDLVNREMEKLKTDGRLENWYKTYMQPIFGEDLGDVLAI